MITLQQFSAMIPTNKKPETWYENVVDMFNKYDITTPLRIAGFMAQCAHESADFTALEENLNYREETLNKVFPRYFGPGKRNAAEYARQPEKIANYVYMDEFRSAKGAMGNTKPGDGWRFRGRGIKQLTGRNNYTAFGKSVGMTAEEAAEYVATPKGALESACWFWATNNIDRFADADDILGMTKKINGGTIGLDDRTSRYTRAKGILGGNVSVAPAKSQVTDAVTQKSAPAKAAPTAARTLRRGMEGEDVKKMQQVLGVDADGIFGPGTATAVKKWQRANGLEADGIVGPKTQARMFG
jgi:putative chitinase